MSAIYINKVAAERIELSNNQQYEDLLDLLNKLTTPGSTLITKLPSGLGLDFNVQDNGLLWIEFYADSLSSAHVTLDVARQILKRAFENQALDVKRQYSDLITQWEY